MPREGVEASPAWLRYNRVMSKTRKERGCVPEDKLREVASPPDGSLFYETLMLNESAVRCMKPSPIMDAGYNMAIECFLIHFRALRDFLCPDDTLWNNLDNVIAFDYDSRWLIRYENWTPCSGDERNRVNKLLAHISYSRRGLDLRWPINEMQQRIMRQLVEFILSLPHGRQEWFGACGLKETMAAAKSRV